MAGLIGMLSSDDPLIGALSGPKAWTIREQMTERIETRPLHCSWVTVIGPCSRGTETLKTSSVLQHLVNSLSYSNVSRIVF